MTCPHDKTACPECNTDGYIKQPAVKMEDIEYHGAYFWWRHAGFWMEKFIEADKEIRRLRG